MREFVIFCDVSFLRQCFVSNEWIKKLKIQKKKNVAQQLSKTKQTKLRVKFAQIHLSSLKQLQQDLWHFQRPPGAHVHTHMQRHCEGFNRL